MWDLDGNRYIDMSIGGIGANVLGYADPEVDGAVIEAIRNGSSSSLNCPEDSISPRSLFVEAMSRKSTATGLSLPTLTTSFSCNTRSSFACM